MLTVARERMYKKRISEWKIKKNYKKQEKDAVYRALKIRTWAGKNSHHITIRDQPVKFQRIMRHMKASVGVTAAQSSNDLLTYRDDDEVQVLTPRPETVPDDQPNLGNTYYELLRRLNLTSGPARPMFTRDDLGSAEIICFESVRYLEAVLPVQAQQRPSFGPGQKGRPATTRSLVSLAASLSCAERYIEARTLLNRACDQLKNEFSDSDPTLLSGLLEAVSNPHGSQSPFKVRRLFHEHVADLCAICLGVGHPITIIMRSLLSVRDRARVVDAVLGSLLATAVKLSEIRSAHILAMKLTVYKTRFLETLGQYQEAEEILHQAIVSCISCYGPRHGLTLGLLTRLAWLSYNCLRNYAEAEVLFRRVLLDDEDEEGAETGREEILAARAGLASIAKMQGDLPKAEKSLRKALNICVRILGRQAGPTALTAHKLEKLLKSGQYLEADHVRASYFLEVDPSA